MNTLFRSLAMATVLSAVAATTAFAQSSYPNGAVATPEYPAGYNNPALSEQTPAAGTTNLPAAENPNVAGASGLSIVRGDRSTINGDRNSTVEQKAWPVLSNDGGND